MMLCVISAIMQGNYSSFKENVVSNFVKWFDSEPKDIGIQCSKAISFFKNSNKYISIDDDALGNGSLMRALPCALLNDEIGLELNIKQGEITHNNKICENIIVEYTEIIQRLIRNEKVDLIKIEKSLLEPTGYIINTYNNALYWASCDSFDGCILGAVNHGGDADTIAAIAGSISGARFGFSYIPKKWIDDINEDTKQKIDEFIRFLEKQNI